MARGISLRRYEEQKTFVANRGDAFRVVVEAYDNVLMPLEVFVHQKRLLDPDTGLEGEDFCYVAAPDDFVLFPVGSPATGQQPAFYRKAKVDVLVPTRELALSMWDAIVERVCELVAALNRKDSLVLSETTRCGAALENDESASVSISVSGE